MRHFGKRKKCLRHSLDKEHKVQNMGKILCYIYEGMADFEISLLLHRLRNTGKKEIVSISENIGLLTAQSGLHYMPDARIEEITDITDCEALILPGGPINNEQNAICKLALDMLEQNKLVAAICFAPQFLGRAGILDYYQYTTSCSEQKIQQLGCKDPFNRGNFLQQRTVTDRNLITAQGYAFVDFAMEVCRYLNIFESKQQEFEQLGRIKG